MKKKIFIFIFFVVLIFALLTYQGAGRGLGTGGIAFFDYPLGMLENGITTVVRGVMNFFRSYIVIAGKEAENKKLVEQIKRMEQDKNEYLEATYENERLRALLELKSQRADYVTSAEVFARDPANWFQVFKINKGLRDGISRNMVAVTPLGIVGRIHRVSENTANVVLITDVNSSVAVRVQSARVEGILAGRGDDKCYLKYIPQDAVISVGDSIITSGLDNIYPEGLQAGYVTNIENREGEFFQRIEVAPAQNPRMVEEISILKR